MRGSVDGVDVCVFLIPCFPLTSVKPVKIVGSGGAENICSLVDVRCKFYTTHVECQIIFALRKVH